MHRNRIQKQGGGWHYIRVPVQKHKHKTPINQVLIDDASDWKSTLIAQLGFYKKRAPYYHDVIELVKEILAKEYSTLAEINISSIKAICGYLGVELNDAVFSEIDLDLEEVTAPDEWSLNICKAMDCNQYINAINGLTFFNRDKFKEAGITINFLDYGNRSYDQGREPFTADLSILDAMMFLSPSGILERLDEYALV